MQKASRTPPVLARVDVKANVVRLPRRPVSTSTDETAGPEEVARLAALMERVSNAVRQIRYFRLAMTRFTFDALISSATRAGFIPIAQHPELKVASFELGAGASDLIFTASYQDPARVSVVAQSRGDIFGLILTAYSQIPAISVEISPTVADGELGENALLFRDLLLTFPDFEDVPAWARYPEIAAPEAAGLVEMWRDGVSLASVVSRTWNSISGRLHNVWGALRARS